MRVLAMVALFLLSVVSSASAELGVCFDTTRSLGSQFYSFHTSPDKIAQDTHCTVITKASGQTKAQDDLIKSTVNRPLLPQPTQPATKYLHVVPDPPTPGGLAVLFDEAKMQEIDDFVTGQVSERQAWADEANTPGVCKYNTPTEIDTKIDQVKANNDAEVDAMTLVAADKTHLKTTLRRLAEGLRQVTTCDAARAGGGK